MKYLHMKFRKSKGIFILMLGLAVLLSACSNTAKTGGAVVDDPSVETTIADETSINKQEPIIIEHAFGTTVIDEKPERVATIAWANQDVPLALGIVPVGISTANYGVLDGSGVLPWTAKAYNNLGVESPNLFNDLTGIDYEAISDTEPDVILAAYSGITQEEYEMLSQIAPVVAYPKNPWQTYWRDQVRINSKGLGLKEEGEKLVSDIERFIEEKVSAYPQIEGKKAVFCWFSPTDLGTFYVYLPSDPRAAYLTDMGMVFPESIYALADKTDSFALEVSAENVDVLSDAELIVTYGAENLKQVLEADPLIGTLPAVKNGSLAVVPEGTPLAAAGTPSPLSIYDTLEAYLEVIGKAAE